MFSPKRHKVLTSPSFWKFVVVSVVVTLLFYVVTSDLQEYHTFFIHNLARPASKNFVCIHLKGGQLERKLFEYAYGFGIAQSLGSYVIMQRNEDMRRVFTLKPVKFLKQTSVCDSFQSISISKDGYYHSNLTSLEPEKNYNLESCDSSKYPSILDFDKYKQVLMQHLQFTKEIESKAETFLQVTLRNEETVKPWTNIAVYLANATNIAMYLANTTDTVNKHYGNNNEYITKYLSVAINYYTTRIPNARFVVYDADISFARKILSNYSIHALYINDKVIAAKEPEVLMRVLSHCDHVITSGAADMFGWWVGYFSKGTVVYPRRNSDDSEDNERTDKNIYPHSWIGLVF